MLQPKYELIVVQAILAGRRADAHDPQSAEIALANLTVSIGEAKSFLDRFFGKFVELALIEVVTLRKAEKFFSDRKSVV